MGRERSARWICGAALCLLILLAGCMGGSDETEPLNETDLDAAQAEDAVQATANSTTADGHLAYEGPDRVLNLSESGSFTVGDGSLAGGWLRGTDTREHDLTQDVPVQAPVTINVTISYSGETSQLDAYWLLEDVEVYDTHYVKDFATNTIWMEALLSRPSNAGTVAAVVRADTTGEAPEREYTLDAVIAGHGSAALPYVPTSVPVTEASGGFALETHDGDVIADALVWGPEGFHGTIEPTAGTLEVELGADDPTGRYVVLARPSGEAAGVHATPIHVRAVNASQAPEEPLALVGTQATQGDWHEVPTADQASWTFNRSSPPVQAGMLFQPTTPIGVSAGPAAFELSLQSPAGPIVELSSGGFIIWGGTGFLFSSFGHENLVEGTYQAEASAGASTSWEVAHVVHELSR